ncbi:hypothetical protein DFH11DRAFT_1746467 [Phellopilus nigrolimitatus]|nr:hypothetical protein DFH11DRAFT_1746467 [Phellopilus nigrolimitatus]
MTYDICAKHIVTNNLTKTVEANDKKKDFYAMFISDTEKDIKIILEDTKYYLKTCLSKIVEAEKLGKLLGLYYKAFFCPKYKKKLVCVRLTNNLTRTVEAESVTDVSAICTFTIESKHACSVIFDDLGEKGVHGFAGASTYKTARVQVLNDYDSPSQLTHAAARPEHQLSRMCDDTGQALFGVGNTDADVETACGPEDTTMNMKVMKEFVDIIRPSRVCGSAADFECENTYACAGPGMIILHLTWDERDNEVRKLVTKKKWENEGKTKTHGYVFYDSRFLPETNNIALEARIYSLRAAKDAILIDTHHPKWRKTEPCFHTYYRELCCMEAEKLKWSLRQGAANCNAYDVAPQTTKLRHRNAAGQCTFSKAQMELESVATSLRQGTANCNAYDVVPQGTKLRHCNAPAHCTFSYAPQSERQSCTGIVVRRTLEISAKEINAAHSTWEYPTPDKPGVLEPAIESIKVIHNSKEVTEQGYKLVVKVVTFSERSQVPMVCMRFTKNFDPKKPVKAMDEADKHEFYIDNSPERIKRFCDYIINRDVIGDDGILRRFSTGCPFQQPQ